MEAIADLRTGTTTTYHFSISSSARLWPLLSYEILIPRLGSGQARTHYASGFAQSLTTQSDPNPSGQLGSLLSYTSLIVVFLDNPTSSWYPSRVHFHSIHVW